MTVLRTPDERFGSLPDFDFDAHYLPVHDPGLGELRMHYVAEGDTDATTVLILHGEPARSFMFRRTIPVLADAGLRVIVPDLVGFGRSDKPAEPTDYSYESHVRWLTEFVTALGVRDAILVGHDDHQYPVMTSHLPGGECRGWNGYDRNIKRGKVRFSWCTPPT